MKNGLSFVLLLLVSCALYAQGRALPRREFQVYPSPAETNIKRGEMEKVLLQVLRSKTFQKRDATFSVGSSLPEGVVIHYEAATADATAVSISATHDAAPGEYNIILNCTISNLTKGVIIKVKVL